MYIGRETNSWYSQNPTDKILYDDYGLFDIEQLTNLVVRFDFVYKNQFFYLLHKINKKLNGISCKCGQRPFIHNFIWTNIFKFGRKTKEKGRPKIGVQEWEQKNFNILKDEIKITQPNLIIFVTGKGIDDDTFFIKRVLGDISTTQIDSQRNIVEIQNDEIDIPMYRVLRPEWQKRDTINTIVNLLVNHYNQNYKESN